MEESAESSSETETDNPEPPESGEKKSRRGLWIFLGIVGAIALAGILLVALIPGFIEAELRKTLVELELERAEFELGDVSFGKLEIRDVDFAGAGWELQAPVIKASYSWRVVFTKRFGAVDFSSATFQLDLERLEEEANEGADDSTMTLSELTDTVPVNLILLDNTLVSLRRGELKEDLTLDAVIGLNTGITGKLEFSVVGAGATAVEVTGSGVISGKRGEAGINTTLSVESLPVLLELANLQIKEDGLEYQLVGLEGTAQINLRSNQLQFGDVDLRSRLAGLTYGDFKLGEADLMVTDDSGSLRLTTSEVEAAYEPDISGKGTVEANLKLGSTLETSLVDGVVRMTSMDLFGIPLAPFEMPMKGNLNTLQFGPGGATFHDLAGVVLAGVEFSVEDMSKPVIHGTGTGILGVQLPGFVASPPNELSLEGAVSLPVTARFKAAADEQEFLIKVNLPDEKATSEELGFDLSGTGSFEFHSRFSEASSETGVNFALPSFEWSKGGDTLALLENLELEAVLAGGSATAEGGGSLNGKSFPIALTYEADGDSQKTEIVIDSIALRDETWLGELIEGWEGSRLSGDLKLVTSILNNDGAITPRIAVTLAHGSLEYPDGETSATGVTGAIEVVSLDPFKLAPRTTLRAERISTSADIDLTNARLSFSVLESGATRLDAFSAQVFGGQISLGQSVTIPIDGSAYTLPISLKSIQAAQIMEFFPQFEGEIDAAVSGRIPIGVTAEGNLQILVGSLALDPDYPATLRYDATGLLTKDLRKRSRAFRINQQVERALGNLSIDGLEVELLDQSDAEHRAIVKLNGVGVDESVQVPVTLNVRVEDKEDILRKILDNVVLSGIKLSF
ncbi:MAG: YdbH domain-containing protein [Verrucomicrobiota bacterium]